MTAATEQTEAQVLDAPMPVQPWWQRLLRDPAALAAALVFLAIVLCALAAPLISPHDPFASSRAVMQPPVWAEAGNWTHPLGTDGQGRDMLSRLFYGTRLTLIIGVVSVAVGGMLGSLLGLLAAFKPGLDPWVMRLVDVMLSFPAILLGLALVAVLGPGAGPVIVALAIATIPDCARIARSIAVSVMKQEYIEAGRALGLSDMALFTRYLLRNCISSIMIFISLRFGQIILIGAALSFLGLGARPPTAELGMMAAQGRDFLLFAPHIAVIPSVLIFVIVLSANILGDALRDVLDPRLRS
ncbi:ABC transporter permease [Jannaschia seohaensis]|uniref:Peptide/nickel transport system permease protein/dipeptide transport system permease protein n=1 Tax=Jannaschia seohaensis TaxID=475081 RepID=A0A2Y9BXS0_9RHOB|nr:ABC transporter permease [Jannaschia seohaensis]PWJ20902.1 peptide/nickel transport system permease protein/dipeptide transport system permease protein [Jannaschia seohaensis]SSA41312.1 peptide/nickel transport system permease protein/dipeptide transport system permease protein [Jannaschia seohaensis]